jgi:tetraacyldisaccharide 4'-kinase
MNFELIHAIIRGERRGWFAWIVRVGLGIASVPYGLAVYYRNWAFSRGWQQTFTAAVPVVSIGNLTVGGTGKTPCVEYVAAQIRDAGLRPVILSRGYGAENGRNDEAMVLEENLPDVPHLQDPDRVALAMTAVEELDAELLILDDGFQHRKLNRQLDIVLLDSSRPLTHEALFPRGLLREPIRSLSRAHVLVLTRCDQSQTANEQAEWLRNRFPGKILAKAVHQPIELVGMHGETQPLELLRNSPVAAFCGIGNPVSFRKTLTVLGAALAEPAMFRQYPDHHAYNREDVLVLSQWASQLPENAIIITTQKDWVKLRVAELGGRKLWALKIGFKLIEGETEFAAAVQSVVNTAVPDDL